jgi:GTP cyclohydrolase II
MPCPTLPERLNRARADLRMGVPVILCGAGRALVVAVETLDGGAAGGPARRFGAPVLAITARRAETLKARVYDGDLARIEVPGGRRSGWLRRSPTRRTI